MAVFKSLTFDGINSLDYGIYIAGEAVYNAPERAVEMVTIPGRNGALAIDQGYFENIEVSYPCGCFAETQADFAEKVSAFRNALASRYSYKRLTDEYNTDEYRLGLYKSGLEVDAVRYGTAGQFNITFDCKPQRFLISGDEERTPNDYTDLQTASGDIVTIENDGTLGVKSLVTDIEPIQSGSGTPSPTNIRPISGHTECVTEVCGKNLLDPQSKTEHNANTWRWHYSDGYVLKKNVAYNFSWGNKDNNSFNIYLYIADFDTGANYNTGNNSVSYKPTEDIKVKFQAYYSGGIPTDAVFQLELGSTATSYEPYNGNIYTTSLGRTVYGGTLDVVSGVLTVTDANIASYNGETLPSTWISDRDVYSSGTTPTTGAQVVYKLASPQTYQLTAQEVELLLGQNNLWASTGSVTVKYGVYPYYNPTEFDARPLIKITGSGNVAIGSQLISVTDIPNTTTVYIDCDTMEIYTLSGGIPSGASSHVSFNGNDFPVLPSGLSKVTYTTRGVSIAPRWWRI